MAKKIEVFSAGCALCNQAIALVMRLSGPEVLVLIHDMHNPEVAAKAKRYGVQTVPAVVVDGKLAFYWGRGPSEECLRISLDKPENFSPD